MIGRFLSSEQLVILLSRKGLRVETVVRRRV